MPEGKLTAEQARVLRWIDENHSNRSSWNALYTHRTVSGPGGSIVFSAEDSVALVDHVQPGKGARLYELSDLGRSALQSRDRA